MSVNYPRGSGRIARSPADTGEYQCASSQKSGPQKSGQREDFELSVCPDVKAERKVVRREQAEQTELMNRVRECVEIDPVTKIWTPRPGREGAEMVYALANENAAGRGIGLQRYLMGVRAGLPDIAIFAPRRGFPAAFIELKQSGGVPSDVRETQRDAHENLSRMGFRVAVCFGWYEAWKFTQWYLEWEQ